MNACARSSTGQPLHAAAIDPPDSPSPIGIEAIAKVSSRPTTSPKRAPISAAWFEGSQETEL